MENPRKGFLAVTRGSSRDFDALYIIVNATRNRLGLSLGASWSRYVQVDELVSLGSRPLPPAPLEHGSKNREFKSLRYASKS